MAWSLIKGREAGDWVAGKSGGGYFAERSEALGCVREGRVVAAVIYENWNRASVVCHFAIDRGGLVPGFCAAIFDYPFNVCGVGKIIGPVPAGNTQSQKLVQHMGFTEEARIVGAHPSGDLIFYTLSRDACRFIRGRYRERLAISATPT